MTSLLVTQAVHPGYRCYASKRCVSVMVSDNNLLVLPKTASDINLIYKLAEEYAPSERLFVATPFWPGAYALLEKKSPMWEIYALFSRNEDFQQKEIERIKESKPGFVIVFDFPLDGREDLRFKNTHPLIQQYILENFEPIPYSQNPAYQIYKGK